MALTLVFLGLPAVLNAQVPQLINYQGRVAVDGVNFDGTGEFKFALVAAAGTNTYWSNDGTSIMGDEPIGTVDLSVTKGLYSVLLGDNALLMDSIPNSVFSNSDVHLRVWFDDGIHGVQLLSPDQRLVAVGYAMVAGEAQTVPDGSISSAKIAANAVGPAQLATNLTLGGTTTGSFSGDGSGLINIPASAIAGDPPEVVPSGMVRIPAGTYILGNSSVDSLDGDISNAAPFAVESGAFYMDSTEVDVYRWQQVYSNAIISGYTFSNSGTGKTAGEFGWADPVQSVNWYDCVKWCNARSEQAGLTPAYYTDEASTNDVHVYRTGEGSAYMNESAMVGYRLPLEMEWEIAARGGLVGQRFPWGSFINQSMANYNSLGDVYDFGPAGYNTNGAVGGTNPATVRGGVFPPNQYGLYEVVGNVSEWCWDFYEELYEDGYMATTGSLHVIRGGSWDSSGADCRLIYRTNAAPNTASNRIGFRTVLSIEP